MEGRVQADDGGEVGLFVRFPVPSDGRALGEEPVVVGGSVAVVVEYQEEGRCVLGFGDEQLARFGCCALRGWRYGLQGDFVELGGGGVGPLWRLSAWEEGVEWAENIRT